MGTATSALQVDTGELPLQLRRLQHQLQYTVKVKSDNNHPADNDFQPNWLTIMIQINEKKTEQFKKVGKDDSH